MLYGYLKTSNHSYHNTTYEKGCFCSLSVFITFLMASVHLCVVVAWDSYRAPDFYRHTLINVWRRTDDRAQREPSGIHYV